MEVNAYIPGGVLSKPEETSSLTSLRDPHSPLRNWQHTSQNADRGSSLTNVTGMIARTFAAFKGPDLDYIGFHPFKIYTTPLFIKEFLEQSVDQTKLWRTFRVRAGRCYFGTTIPDSSKPTAVGLLPTGTDKVDDAWTNNYFLANDGATITDVQEYELAEDVAQNWFWVALASDGKTASIKTSATPTTEGWLDFPNFDPSSIYPIGYVDTKTFLTKKIANVVQIVRGDLLPAGSSSDIPVWL